MKLPLRLYVSGAFGNIATFFGAFAECVPVGLHGTRANYEPLRSSQSPLQRLEVPWSGRKLPVNPWQARGRCANGRNGSEADSWLWVEGQR